MVTTSSLKRAQNPCRRIPYSNGIVTLLFDENPIVVVTKENMWDCMTIVIATLANSSCIMHQNDFRFGATIVVSFSFHGCCQLWFLYKIYEFAAQTGGVYVFHDVEERALDTPPSLWRAGMSLMCSPQSSHARKHWTLQSRVRGSSRFADDYLVNNITHDRFTVLTSRTRGAPILIEFKNPNLIHSDD